MLDKSRVKISNYEKNEPP